MEMILTKCRTFMFGHQSLWCRGGGSAGASVMIANAYASFGNGGNPRLQYDSSSHSLERGVYRSRVTAATLGGFIAPGGRNTWSCGRARERRLVPATVISQIHSGSRSSIFYSPTKSGAPVDGEGLGQGKRIQAEQHRLLGALEEELPQSVVEEIGEECHEEEGPWGELDESELKRLGIEIIDEDNVQDFHEQLKRAWGTVTVENQQHEYEIDAAALQATLRRAMEVLECQAWDVGAVLTTDKEVLRLNNEYRGVEAATDILSFPMADMTDQPGVLPEVRHPAEMDLGDMFVSLAYVDRQIERDREEEEDAGDMEEPDEKEDGAEWWDRGRGVSGAMSKTFDLQERTSMLLIHGLIHLLGHDHETPEDYETMVRVEEAVLAAVWGETRP